MVIIVRVYRYIYIHTIFVLFDIETVIQPYPGDGRVGEGVHEFQTIILLFLRNVHINRYLKIQ